MVFVSGMATMFVLLYFSLAYTVEPSIPTPRITQEQALQIADADLKQRLSDYKGIVGIIDTSWERYIPVAEFEENHLDLPLVYVHPNGSLILVTDTTYENKGTCDSGLFAYCGWYDKYNFDYGSRLIYGAEIQIDSDEALVMYMIDATNGKIVDSTFLRSDWIRSHNAEES